MKKILYLFIMLSVLVFGCTKDLQEDIDELKQQIADLEGTDVASMEFQGSNLVITFGDGSTSTVTVPPEVIPSRVTDFDIDNETGVITVTFSDGTTSEYLVLSNNNTTYLSGTLTGDYGISSMTIGDVTLANLSYDNQNRMVQALINFPDYSGNVINVLDLQNNYADTKPQAIAIRKSLHSDFDYDYEESLNYTYEYFDVSNDYNFVEEDLDGMLTLYRYRYWNGSQYRYEKWEHCWFVEEDDINHNSYDKYYPVAGEDSLFYRSYNNYVSMDVDGEYGRVYFPNNIIRITDIYQQGEAMDTSKVNLTLANDLIVKVEMLDWETEEVIGYSELTYDVNKLVTAIDMFDIYDPEDKGDGINPDTANFARILMTYDNSYLTKVEFAELDEDGLIVETDEIVKFVYDNVGNPVEIWAVAGYEAGEGYIFDTDPSGAITITPIEVKMSKLVEIEYDYTLPNFFGKTLEYLIPELKGLKISNAPVRLSHSGFFDFVSMEYFDYNAGGYPAKVKMEAYLPMMFSGPRKGPSPFYGFGLISTPIATEMLLEYTLME